MPANNPNSSRLKSAHRPAPAADLLRLESHALQALHSALNAESKGAADARREFSRWAMRDRRIEATFHHPGGTSTRCLVAPRELSAGGAGVLHGGFVYPGATCMLHLKTLKGEARDTPGVIARCRHVGKHVHSLGIRFNDRIDPREFVRPSASFAGFTLERVAPDRLAGRALVVDPDRTGQRLVAHFLKDTKLEAEYAQDVDAARESVQHGFDAVIIADGSCGVSAAEFLLAIRESGVMTPAVVLAADHATPLTEAAAQAGCVVIVGKPFDAPTLHRALGEFLLLRGGPALGVGSIVSSMGNEPGVRELIENFVYDLERAADEAASAVRKNDGAACRAVCQRLKGNGASHGFSIVTETAAAALAAMGDANCLEAAGAEIRRVIEVCRRCTAG